jgi:small subunit ribosomal protein S1
MDSPADPYARLQRTEVVIPAPEHSLKHDVDPSDAVCVGKAVGALLVQKKDKDGRPDPVQEARRVRARLGHHREDQDDGGVVTGPVIEVVKGGLILDIGLCGFLPTSEIEIRKASSLQEYVGRQITAKILELDHYPNAVVLSRKAWLKENPIEQRRPIVAFIFAHWPNQIAAAALPKLISSGAFVSLGVGVEGWIHLSELAGRYVEDPKQIVRVGDDVFLKILDMDPDKGRISLSLKQANDAALVQEFDPTLYGMTAEFDEQGNYKYPEGFDTVTKEWLAGHEGQRQQWEKQYTDAHTKWEAHRAQVEGAAIDDAVFPSKAKRPSKKARQAPRRQPRPRRSRQAVQITSRTHIDTSEDVDIESLPGASSTGGSRGPVSPTW